MKQIFSIAVGLVLMTSSTGCSWLFCHRHHGHHGHDCCNPRCDHDDCDKHHRRGHCRCRQRYPGYYPGCYANPCCYGGYSSYPYSNNPYYPTSTDYGYAGASYPGYNDGCGCDGCCGNSAAPMTSPMPAPMMMEQGPTPALPGPQEMPQQQLGAPPAAPGAAPPIAPVPNPVPTPGTDAVPAPNGNGPSAGGTSGIPTVRAGLYGGPVQYNQLGNQQVYDVSRGQWVQLQ